MGTGRWGGGAMVRGNREGEKGQEEVGFHRCI